MAVDATNPAQILPPPGSGSPRPTIESIDPRGERIHDGLPIRSPYKNSPPFLPVNPVGGQQLEAAQDIQETTEKTNHFATLCFGSAVVFMGLSFYDGYCFLGERTFSLLIRGVFWVVVATIIGTAGEILQKTARVEAPVVPHTDFNHPVVLKEGQFPGMPNMGNTCFINAPTQALMNDREYPRVFKSICERAKRRHESFKKFLELYPSQNRYLPSFKWPKLFSRTKEATPPLAVENVQDVLMMLTMRRSSLKYDSLQFQERYPTIHRLIGEFSRITKDADFPAISDSDVNLRAEFSWMKDDSHIVQFFYGEKFEIANELLGFEAYLNLITAYETAVGEKSPVVSFGRWLASPLSSPIGNIRYLIKGAGVGTQEDVEEFLHCLSKYVLPDDYPEVFFPITYERYWEECPAEEQDQERLQQLMEMHEKPRNSDDILTELPENKKILEKPSPFSILKIESLLREGVDGQELINETFGVRRTAVGPNDPNKQTHVYLDKVTGRAKKYYMVAERTVMHPDKIPERMILELVRYKWINTELGKRREKIDCNVNMPEQIDIYHQTYRLKSVVMHTGSPDNGHYHAVVNRRGQWWYASDSTVDLAEQMHVDQTSRNGYLYFYERIVPAALE